MTAPPEVTQLATTVSNLVVTPSINGVSMSYTTNIAVRAQLQIGPSSGTYSSKFGIESVARTAHVCSGYGLTAATTYHYILAFFDHNGVALDQTSDATFTTAATPAAAPTSQGMVNGPPAGGGISVNTAASAPVAGSANSTIAQDANTVASKGGSGVAMVAGKLTVQQTGFYMVFASIQTAAVIDGSNNSYVNLILGGSQMVGTNRMFPLAPGSSGTSAYLGSLSAGTTIEVRVVNGTATATTVSSGSIAVGGVA